MKKNVYLSIKLLFLVFVLTFSSCEPDNQEITETENGTSGVLTDFQTEMAYPNDRGVVEKITFYGEEVEVEKTNNNYVFEGDILVTPDEVNSNLRGKKSTGRLDKKWPNNTVYYVIAGNLPNQARVTNAIAHWTSRTNLRFIKRTNQAAYIYFQPGTGCSSFVGRTGGRQAITLANGCTTGSTIHEIGHAIGLFHEQSRMDRDKFIKILFENISPGLEHNFQTWKARGFNGRDLTSTLDFGSIMMYDPKAFSKNGKPTITKRNGSLYSVQRTALSRDDIAGIGKLYPRITPPPVVTKPVPLYRYFLPGNDHLYTTNLSELGRGRNGYKYEGVQCRIYPTKVSGTVPLYRYYNAGIKDSFYTRNYAELGGGRNGYRYLGVAGYVYAGGGSGRVKLYRYFLPGKDHFYTTNYNELGAGKNGYKYEGVAAYVLR